MGQGAVEEVAAQENQEESAYVWDLDSRFGLKYRRYSLWFAMGFLIVVRIMVYLFKAEKKPQTDLDSPLLTIVLPAILGARLGHFLFYEPSLFLHGPLQIITPPSAGLASHVEAQ